MTSSHARWIELLPFAFLAACSAAPTAPPAFASGPVAADPPVPAVAPGLQSGASTITRASTRPVNPEQMPPPPAEPGRFSFGMTPYLWWVGAEGNADIGGGNNPVHASFGSMYDSMDPAYGIKFEMGPEPGPYKILFDSNYESISQDIRFGEFHAYHSMFEGDFAWRLSQQGYLDALIGIRWTELDSVATNDVLNTATASSRSWADPIVGIRGTMPLFDKLYLDWRGDVGGFGVGSDFTGQLDASFRFQFSRMFGGIVGWRYVKVDYSSSTLDYDVAMSGPYAAMTFVF
jgi:hypothetical protein